jgi:integrase
MRRYGELLGPQSLTTFADVIDRYLRSIEFTKRSERTRKDYLRYLVPIRAVFGGTPARAITAPEVRTFRDKIAAKSGVVQANRHLELLKRLLTLATQWGAIQYSPAREVPKFGKADGAGPRERYVTEAEFSAVYQLARPAVRVAMRLALLTGLRRGDLVALTRRNVTDEGLVVPTAKTARPLVFSWTPELHAEVDAGLALWPRKYPTPLDQPIILAKGRRAFTGDGLWQAFSTAVAAAKLAEPFTLHDLRAKSSSDTDSLEAASARLGHTSTATTQRTYRRKPAKVDPLR